MISFLEDPFGLNVSDWKLCYFIILFLCEGVRECHGRPNTSPYLIDKKKDKKNYSADIFDRIGTDLLFKIRGVIRRMLFRF